MQIQHLQQIEDIESDNQKEIARLFDQESELRNEIYDLKQQNTDLNDLTKNQAGSIEKMQEELDWFIKKGEEETQVRIKFESKINNLHSLHRSLEAKYARAIEDIRMLENMNKFYIDEREKLSKDNTVYSNRQIELERQVADIQKRFEKAEIEIDV